MLYSRKIVLVIAACVVAVSASGNGGKAPDPHQGRRAEIEQAKQAVTTIKKEKVDDSQKAGKIKRMKVANATVALLKSKLERDIARTARKDANAEYQTAKAAADAAPDNDEKKVQATNLKATFNEQDAIVKNFEKIVNVAKDIVSAVGNREDAVNAFNDEDDENAKKPLEKKKQEANMALEYLVTLKDLAFATEVDPVKAAEFAVLRASLAAKTSFKPYDDVHHPTELKCVKAVLKALKAAKVAEINAQTAQVEADEVSRKLTDETKARATLQAESDAAKAKADKESDKNMFQQFWGYIKSPFSKYSDARKKEFVKSDGEKGQLSHFGAFKHALTPSSGTGKAAYVGLAGAAAAGAFGGYKYVENGNEKRKSNSRKKMGLAVAGLAAAGATVFAAHKGYEAYQAKQNAGESEMFDDEETGAPQSSGKNSDPAPVGASSGGQSKNKNGTKPKKKSNKKWMIWAAVIVLALAVIGGALYYFLFMTEEGSEEDAVPEGMDQV